jgi:hypothetical protein
MLGSAEISDFTIENVTEPDKPFVYKFKIRVPDFASKTGKRLFFQPNVFERNSQPLFTAGARKYDIRINFAWAESDDIEIDLPVGYSIEVPDAGVIVADAQGISSDDIKISLINDGKTLVYKRNFYFGNKGVIIFPVKNYLGVKSLFDRFYKANTRLLTLKQGAGQ